MWLNESWLHRPVMTWSCSSTRSTRRPAAGKSKPFLIVMPFGYGIPPGSASPIAGGNIAAFSLDLLEDVIPFIESHYRAYTDRDRQRSRRQCNRGRTLRRGDEQRADNGGEQEHDSDQQPLELLALLFPATPVPHHE